MFEENSLCTSWWGFSHTTLKYRIHNATLPFTMKPESIPPEFPSPKTSFEKQGFLRGGQVSQLSNAASGCIDMRGLGSSKGLCYFILYNKLIIIIHFTYVFARKFCLSSLLIYLVEPCLLESFPLICFIFHVMCQVCPDNCGYIENQSLICKLQAELLLAHLYHSRDL